MPVTTDAPFDLVGTYQLVETINAKLELTTVENRSELAGNYVRMKGKTKGKEEVAAAGEVFVLPPGLRPPAAVVLDVTMETEAGVPSANTLKIATNGKCTIGAALPAKSTINFDGQTFSLN